MMVLRRSQLACANVGAALLLSAAVARAQEPSPEEPASAPASEPAPPPPGPSPALVAIEPPLPAFGWNPRHTRLRVAEYIGTAVVGGAAIVLFTTGTAADHAKLGRPYPLRQAGPQCAASAQQP